MTVNPLIVSALEEADKLSGCKVKLSKKQEILDIVQNKSTLQWMDFIKISKIKYKKDSASKYALALLIICLNNDLYKDKYNDKLCRDLKYLKQCLNNYIYSYITLFTENYEDVKFINVTSGNQKKLRTVLIQSGDKVFTQIFIKYLEEHHNAYKPFYKIYYTFVISAGTGKLESHKDINDSTFWHQVHFYKEFYKNNKKDREQAIESIGHFYRWLITKYPDYNFFENSKSLTNELIQNNALVKNINKNAYFTTYGITENLEDKPIICFIVKNFDSYSTRMNKVSHIVINSSIVNNSFYRTIFNKYIQNNQKETILSGGMLHYPLEALHFLESVKVQKDYPNKNIKHLNTQEAILIRNFVESCKPKQSLPTLNNNIGAIRRFLKWCDSNNYLNFDTTFFDYFSQFEEPNKFYGQAIPDEDIKKISNEFIKLCKKDENYLMYYAIFIILLETEFRASQVCSLTVSSLQPTLKKDQFYLYSNTKTTHGRKIQQPICIATKSILSKVIELTESLRNNSVQESTKDLIFLYKKSNGAICPVDVQHFRNIFQNVCLAANIKKYHTRNLRDTHMTKAFEFILKSGKSDIEMGLLSKHSVIDTTKNHYIEIELTKMLESIYQVTLGSRDVTQKEHILNELPNDLCNEKTKVEGGCGHCNAKSCNMTGNIPCLMCKHFVTTPSHKPYFIKMISNCDKLLSQTSINHEKEDLTLIKTLYASWLRELCIIEEEDK